jgi:hypothetical protein
MQSYVDRATAERRLETMRARRQIGRREKAAALRWRDLFDALSDDRKEAFLALRVRSNFRGPRYGAVGDREVKIPRPGFDPVFDQLQALDFAIGPIGSRIWRLVIAQGLGAKDLVALDGGNIKTRSRDIRGTSGTICMMLTMLAEMLRVPQPVVGVPMAA